MKRKKEGVKQHIKLLDKPIWTPSRKVSHLGCWDDGKGFEISSSLRKLPLLSDRLVLADLMGESQRREDARILQFDSMYYLLKLCKLASGTPQLAKMEETLATLQSVSLFYTSGVEYDTVHHRKSVYGFGILDEYRIEPGNVCIMFNKTFLKLNQDRYSRRIRLELMKQIGREISPFALRLYEILSIFLHHTGTFNIDIENLALKMGIQYEQRFRYRFLDDIREAVSDLRRMDLTMNNLDMAHDSNRNVVTFQAKIDM